MSKGWLLFWTSFLIGCAIADVNAGYIGSATFESIFGIGVGVNLVKRFMKEDE